MIWRAFVITLSFAGLVACSDPVGPRLPEPEEEGESEPDTSTGVAILTEVDFRIV